MCVLLFNVTDTPEIYTYGPTLSRHDALPSSLSARTPAALVQAAARLGAHLAAAPDCNLADVAWTLASGRKAFAHRLALVAGDAADAATQLRGDELASTAARSRPARDSDVVFMFPGQGAVYPEIGRAHV